MRDECIDSLIESMNDHRLILFVGSAISKFLPTNFPSGETIANAVKHELQSLDCLQRYDHQNYLERIWSDVSFEGLLDLPDDKKKVLQLIYRLLGSNCQPNSIHFFIAELLDKNKISAIITPNYDIAIEKAYEDHTNGRKLPIIYQQKEKSNVYNLPSLLLFKIHGSIDAPPKEIIYSLSQEGQELPSWKKELLKNLLIVKDILYLGYSGYDFDICPWLFREADIPINKIYWSVDDENKLSPEAKGLLKKYRSELLLGDMRILFSNLCKDERLKSDINYFYYPPKDPRDENINQWKLVEDAFGKIFNDEVENQIWLIKALNKMGVGRDAIQQCISLLNREKTSKDENRLSIIEREMGQALFHFGKYKQATEWFKTSGKSSKNVHSFFNSRIHSMEAVRCQGKLLTFGSILLFTTSVFIALWLPLTLFRKETLEKFDSAGLWQRWGQLCTKIKFFPKKRKITDFFLKRAEYKYKRHGDFHGERDVSYRMIQTGVPEEEFKRGSELADAYTRVGYAIGTINTRRDQAKKAIDKKDFSLAEKLINESIDLAEKIGDIPGCVKGYRILNEAQRCQGNENGAKKSIVKAYDNLLDLEITGIHKPKKIKAILDKITFG